MTDDAAQLPHGQVARSVTLGREPARIEQLRKKLASVRRRRVVVAPGYPGPTRDERAPGAVQLLGTGHAGRHMDERRSPAQVLIAQRLLKRDGAAGQMQNAVQRYVPAVLKKQYGQRTEVVSALPRFLRPGRIARTPPGKRRRPRRPRIQLARSHRWPAVPVSRLRCCRPRRSCAKDPVVVRIRARHIVGLIRRRRVHREFGGRANPFVLSRLDGRINCGQGAMWQRWARAA